MHLIGNCISPGLRHASRRRHLVLCPEQEQECATDPMHPPVRDPAVLAVWHILSQEHAWKRAHVHGVVIANTPVAWTLDVGERSRYA